MQLICFGKDACSGSLFFSYVLRLSCGLDFKVACSKSPIFIRMKAALQLSFQGCLQRVTQFRAKEGYFAAYVPRMPAAALHSFS